MTEGSGPEEELAILTCVPAERLAGLAPHPELDMFRPPDAQHRALTELAAEPSCCVTVAISGGTMLGYAVFHPPSSVESWSREETGRLVELGAVEVAPSCRGHRLAERLLRASFACGRFDDTVVFATMYVWHYDLTRTGLTDFAYKRLLDKLYRKVGMVPMPTTDPEIRSNAANQLMVRIGPDAGDDVVRAFHRIRTRPAFPTP